jgi:hypothetical protein
MNWFQAITGGIYDGLASRATVGEAPAKIASGDINSGDVNIISITAFKADSQAKADYKEYVTEIHIYESIVSPVIYCVLHVKDAVNLAGSFLAIGDVVQIKFQTPGGITSEYFFQVHRPEIDRRKVPSLALEVYAIELISVEGLAARDISMEGYNIKDTAGNLIEKILKDKIEVHPDVKKIDTIRQFKSRHNIDKGHGIIGKNKLQLGVLPNNSKGILRRPFDTIHQLAILNSKSPEGDALYTFFERRDGYYFKPIEKLIKEGKKYIRQNQTDRLFYYDHLRNQDESAIKFRNILAYSIINADTKAAGDVNSEGRTYNPDKGETSKNVGAEVDNNLAELTSPQAMKQFTAVTRSDFITSTEYDHLVEVSAKRRQLLLRIGQYEAQIMIYGDSNLTVGEVIECNLPTSMSTAPDSSDPNQASSISKDAAPYLITHLRHIILNTDRPQHVMSCNLLRANAPRS